MKSNDRKEPSTFKTTTKNIDMNSRRKMKLPFFKSPKQQSDRVFRFPCKTKNHRKLSEEIVVEVPKQV